MECVSRNVALSPHGSNSNVNISELPVDCIFEIFKRLPVNQLGEMFCLNNQWAHILHKYTFKRSELSFRGVNSLLKLFPCANVKYTESMSNLVIEAGNNRKDRFLVIRKSISNVSCLRFQQCTQSTYQYVPISLNKVKLIDIQENRYKILKIVEANSHGSPILAIDPINGNYVFEKKSPYLLKIFLSRENDEYEDFPTLVLDLRNSFEGSFRLVNVCLFRHQIAVAVEKETLICSLHDPARERKVDDFHMKRSIANTGLIEQEEGIYAKERYLEVYTMPLCLDPRRKNYTLPIQAMASNRSQIALAFAAPLEGVDEYVHMFSILNLENYTEQFHLQINHCTKKEDISSFMMSETMMCVCVDNKFTHFWCLKTGKYLGDMRRRRLAISGYHAAVRTNNRIGLWDMLRRRRFANFKLKEVPVDIKYKKGEYLLALFASGEVKRWNARHAPDTQQQFSI